MGEKDRLIEIEKALREFIIRATKKEAPSYAVQALPGVIGKYLELNEKLRILR